jgi:Uma2 family endonuclease
MKGGPPGKKTGPPEATMTANAALHDFDPELDLVLEDGVPMESWYHRLQMVLFIELIRFRMLELGQTDVFVNGDMFCYYSQEQAREVAEEERQIALFEAGKLPEKPEKTAYRGPDVMLVRNVPNRKRDVWKVWEEDERYPDLILELLSPSTVHLDYGVKKDLYQDLFKTSDYFLYTPDSWTAEGFRLLDHVYQPIPRSSEGRLWSRVLEAEVGVWHGPYEDQTAHWLRLFRPDGSLVPTKDERAEAAEQRAEQERQAKEAAEQRADTAEQRAEQERRARSAAEREIARLRAQLGLD